MRVPDQRHLWLGNGHRGRCALTRTVNASHARRAFLQPTRAHVHAIAHLKLSAMAGCLSVKTAGHEVRANQAASVRRHFLRVTCVCSHVDVHLWTGALCVVWRVRASVVTGVLVVVRVVCWCECCHKKTR